MLNSRLDSNVTWPARTTCTWCHFTHPGWKVYVLEFFYLKNQNIISIILTFQSFLPPNYWPLFVLGGWKSPLADAFFSKTILHFPSASSVLICLSLRENIVKVKLSLEDCSEYLAMFTFSWRNSQRFFSEVYLFVCVSFLHDWDMRKVTSSLGKIITTAIQSLYWPRPLDPGPEAILHKERPLLTVPLFWYLSLLAK